MDYKKFLENNKPFLLCESMPFLSKLCKSKITFIVLLSLALIIILSATIYMIFQDKKTVNKILISRESTLNAKLTRLENVNDMLEAEILLLKNDVKALSRKKDRKKINKISKYLADTQVISKGIEITVKDDTSAFASVQDENSFVHNTDLLKIVNLLWTRGANAICVNNERITPRTSISCVGPTIIINQKRIVSPFKIIAAGENFNEKEIKNDAFVLSLKLRGIEFEINKKDEVLIPAGKYVTFRE